MKTNTKIVQLTLVSIGTLLILATYFLYPKISKNKLLEEGIVQNNQTELDGEATNIFENIEYKGLYDINNPFTVKAKKAYILKEQPDVVYMFNMKVILYLSDGRIVTITSDKGNYNKVTYDCFFENNVKAVDGETTILSENFDLLATEDTVIAYKNVVLTNDKGSLRADKVHYDVLEKYYKISMFNDKNNKVKIKLIK